MGNSVNAQKIGEYYSVLAIVDNADVYQAEGATKVNFYSLRGTLDPWQGIDKRIEEIKRCL